MMSTEQHPITPPLELVQQWRDSPEYTDGKRKLVMVTLSTGKLQDIATKASQWGADQELEACCADIYEVFGKRRADWLRAARRPKPPSLADQALEAHERSTFGKAGDRATIRAALERLKELEEGQ